MVTIDARLPLPSEYMKLRASVGWRVPADHDCERALRHSLAGVVALAGGEVVGMGRVVGDGAFYCFIVDLVVDPRHQHQRIGTQLLEKLEAVVAQSSAVGVVNLVADDDVVDFYRRVGYAPDGSSVLKKVVTNL